MEASADILTSRGITYWILIKYILLLPTPPYPTIENRSLKFLNQESIQIHRLGILHPEAAWDAITEDVVLKAL